MWNLNDRFWRERLGFILNFLFFLKGDVYMIYMGLSWWKEDCRFCAWDDSGG